MSLALYEWIVLAGDIGFDVSSLSDSATCFSTTYLFHLV